MNLKILFKAFPENSKCPSCGNFGRLRKSRSRNFLENVFKFSRLLGIYKCRECGWRGYLKKYTFNRYSLITLSFYLLIVVTVGYIISKVLQRNFGD